MHDPSGLLPDKISSKLTSKKDEINSLDKVLNKNINSTNDIRLLESKAAMNVNGVKEPTPVTYFNILKKSKSIMKVRHEGLSVLFDSGSSHSMIIERVVDKQQWKRMRNPVGFESCNGAFELQYKTDVILSFPELNAHRVITWQCYVDERDDNELGYDMIIGRDLMTSIGIQIDFQNKMLKWDGAELEMRDFSLTTPT